MSGPAWPHGRGVDAGTTGPSLSPDQPDHQGARTESIAQNKIHIDLLPVYILKNDQH